jgi:hypothetical protein
MSLGGYLPAGRPASSPRDRGLAARRVCRSWHHSHPSRLCSWTQEYDRDGDVYFEDHNSGLLTYDDPRLVAEPSPATSIPGRLQPMVRQKTKKAFKTRFTVKNKVR